MWCARVRTDLEKSLNLTLVLENSRNLKKGPFIMEFCKIALENVDWSWKINKKTHNDFLDLCDAQK